MQCPFCHAPIREALVRHGGTCPACLHVIPGEEAPTHPGDEAVAEIRKADVAQARKRANQPLMIGLPVFLLALGGVAYALWPQPPLEKLEFASDEFDFKIGGQELVAASDVAEHAAVPVVDAKGAGQRRPGNRLTNATGVADALGGGPAVPQGQLATGTTGATTSGAASHQVDTTGAAAAREQGGLAPGGLSTGGSSSSSLDVAFNARRTAALLENTADIKAAVSTMLRQRVPRLQQCYERSLKMNESLDGTWVITFVVAKDGNLKDVKATGQQMHDAAFEGCLVSEASAWSILGQLAKEYAVTKGVPVSFSPSF